MNEETLVVSKFLYLSSVKKLQPFPKIENFELPNFASLVRVDNSTLPT